MDSSSLILEECQNDEDVINQDEEEDKALDLLNTLLKKDHQSHAKKQQLQELIEKYKNMLISHNIDPQTGKSLKTEEYIEHSIQTSQHFPEDVKKNLEISKNSSDSNINGEIFDFDETLSEQILINKKTQTNTTAEKVYLQQVEALAFKKCKEVDRLTSILASYEKKSNQKQQFLNSMNQNTISALQEENLQLKKEIDKLNSKLSKIKKAVSQFKVSHVQSQMERKTQSLQQFASFKGKCVKNQLDLFDFILKEFEGCVDIGVDLTEENIRNVIHQAALQLKHH